MAIPSNKMKENINDMLFPNPQEINSCCYKTQEEEGKNNFWSLSDFSLGLREPQKNLAFGLLRVTRIAAEFSGKKREQGALYWYIAVLLYAAISITHLVIRQDVYMIYVHREVDGSLNKSTSKLCTEENLFALDVLQERN